MSHPERVPIAKRVQYGALPYRVKLAPRRDHAGHVAGNAALDHSEGLAEEGQIAADRPRAKLSRRQALSAG